MIDLSDVISLGAIAAINTVYSQGTTFSPIILDSVGCTGMERRLLDCPNRGLLVHSCSHSNDAGVSCMPGMLSMEVTQYTIMYIIIEIRLQKWRNSSS